MRIIIFNVRKIVSLPKSTILQQNARPDLSNHISEEKAFQYSIFFAKKSEDNLHAKFIISVARGVLSQVLRAQPSFASNFSHLKDLVQQIFHYRFKIF